MKKRPTDLAQYELLHGKTEYDYEFPTAPSCELLVDVYSDRPAHLYLHIVKGSIDRWVNVVSSERRIEFRGRFANCVGARIHCAKEATLNCLVIGNPVGVDPVDYTPAVMHAEIPQLSEADKLRREFRAMLDARLPQRTPKKEIDVDPDLMGDEIPQLAGGNFEIADDDPLDPMPGIDLELHEQAEPHRDPVPDPDRTRPDPDRGSAPAAPAPDPDRAAATRKPPAARPAAQVDPERQRDDYFG